LLGTAEEYGRAPLIGGLLRHRAPLQRSTQAIVLSIARALLARLACPLGRPEACRTTPLRLRPATLVGEQRRVPAALLRRQLDLLSLRLRFHPPQLDQEASLVLREQRRAPPLRGLLPLVLERQLPRTDLLAHLLEHLSGP
jgi:hypothetical protein